MLFPYYQIVTFGKPSFGSRKSYYRSLYRARSDARTLRGGSLTNARIVGCQTRAEALGADISDSFPVVETV